MDKRCTDFLEKFKILFAINILIFDISSVILVYVYIFLYVAVFPLANLIGTKISQVDNNSPQRFGI